MCECVPVAWNGTQCAGSVQSVVAAIRNIHITFLVPWWGLALVQKTVDV